MTAHATKITQAVGKVLPGVVLITIGKDDYEKLVNILEHKPTFVTDAIDRLIFYERKIKGREHQVNDIARNEFGNDYEKALFSGYSRIFAEFLGHLTVARPQLLLEGYKERIINKITKN